MANKYSRLDVSSLSDRTNEEQKQRVINKCADIIWDGIGIDHLFELNIDVKAFWDDVAEEISRRLDA